MGRSKARKPTLAQKKQMTAAGMIACNWLVIWENAEELRLVNRLSGTSRSIKKSPQPGSRRAYQNNLFKL